MVEIIGLVVLIATFGIERFLNAQRESQSDKYNWFLNIIVQPNLHTVEKNYSQISEMLLEAIEDLRRKSEAISFKDYLILQRKKINEFRRIRKTYFNNFSSLVRSYDPKLANKVDKNVNKLDDIYTETLDKIKEEKELDTLEITAEIFKNQSDLYAILFSEIRRGK